MKEIEKMLKDLERTLIDINPIKVYVTQNVYDNLGEHWINEMKKQQIIPQVIDVSYFPENKNIMILNTDEIKSKIDPMKFKKLYHSTWDKEDSK